MIKGAQSALDRRAGPFRSFQSREVTALMTSGPPGLWNDPPEQISLEESLTSFKSLPKTHFYIPSVM